MGAWFFVDEHIGDSFLMTGENAQHALKSLRMTVGEKITLCDKNSVIYKSTINQINKDSLVLDINSSEPCSNEPFTKITLYQALTKGDKMDTIIQKAVELGVSEIVPVLTSRCISRPDSKTMDKKIIRWQKISKQAAMQSRRGIIPKIRPMMSLEQAGSDCTSKEKSMVFYENGGNPISSIIKKDTKSLGFFVGCEGGFDIQEIQYLNKLGIPCASLGKRILRTETAPLAALSIIMYITEELN